MHDTMQQFCKYAEIQGRHETARAYSLALSQFDQWIETQNIDPLRATTENIRHYQAWLAQQYRSSCGALLARSTQATRLAGLKSYYGWLERRGLVLTDISRKIILPRIHRRVTKKDYLSLQEATALLQAKMSRTMRYVEGSFRWAREFQALTLLSIGLASGRRRSTLLRIRVSDLDFEQNEIRIEREKGKIGKVLPITLWAMTVSKVYIVQARPVLNWKFNNDWLFVGEKSPRLSSSYFQKVLDEAHRQTVAENPDLTDLARKHITPHSLRVSFAKLLFQGGCNIRSINELMDHKNLTTTACYTPINIEDLRRICQRSHPRA